MVAAPSDQTLHVIWSVWSASYFLFSAVTIVVFLGVVSSYKVRKKAFNLYLIFLMIPDIIFSFFCAIQCAVLASAGGYTEPWECKLQSVYLVFGISANAWLNGVITFELHRLLRLSRRRQRYFPPTHKQIAKRAAMVYTYSVALAVIGVLSIDWLPYETRAQKGVVCIPGRYSQASTVFFWCVFFPMLVAVPLVFAVIVSFDIWRRSLMPESGKARELSLYFFRLVIVFVIMWLPAALVLYVLGDINEWIFYTLATWSHAQGAVSALCSMKKDDVYQAVMDFVHCRNWWVVDEKDDRTIIEQTEVTRPRGTSSFWTSFIGAASLRDEHMCSSGLFSLPAMADTMDKGDVADKNSIDGAEIRETHPSSSDEFENV